MKREEMRVIAALLVVLSVLGPVLLHAGQPFAPKAEIPPDIREGSTAYLDVVNLKGATVPDRRAVWVPPYPGAKIVRTSSLTMRTINDEQVVCLPTVQLYSTDSPSKVVRFYKEQLKGFRHNGQRGGWRGVVDVFWKDTDRLDIMDRRQVCITPSLVISKMGWNKIVPKTRTLIEITY